MASLPYPRSHSLSSLLHLFIFRAERLGREKVLKVVGLNPTGITRGCSLSRLHISILGGYGILPYPRSPLMIVVVFLGGYGILPYPRSLSFSSLCCTFLYTHAALIHPFLLFASTDADVRIDRRRCPHRPAQTSASTDADGRSRHIKTKEVTV